MCSSESLNGCSGYIYKPAAVDEGSVQKLTWQQEESLLIVNWNLVSTPHVAMWVDGVGKALAMHLISRKESESFDFHFNYVVDRWRTAMNDLSVVDWNSTNTFRIGLYSVVCLFSICYVLLCNWWLY